MINSKYTYEAGKVLVSFMKTRHENEVVEDVQDMIDALNYSDVMYCLQTVYSSISYQTDEMAGNIESDECDNPSNKEHDLLMHLVILMNALHNRRNEIILDEF